MNKKDKAYQLAVEITRIILEENNGYDSAQIIDENLAEECEGHPTFDRIQELLLKKL